ncbi:MAG: hypothetical protein J6X07_06695 [Prevotella sp.]|nr:hypothetical protein [Prevotella sp.]
MTMRQAAFVRVNYSIFADAMWQERRKFSRFEAWLDLRRRASVRPTKSLNEGEVRATWRELATDWGWHKTEVERFLKLLVSKRLIAKTGKSVFQVVPEFVVKSVAESVAKIVATQPADNQEEKGCGVAKIVAENVAESVANPPYNNKKRRREDAGARAREDASRPAGKKTLAPGITQDMWDKFGAWAKTHLPILSRQITPEIYGYMYARAFQDTKRIAKILTRMEEWGHHGTIDLRDEFRVNLENDVYE